MSGIYIPGIETSKTCAFCRFCDGIADTQLGACAYCVVDGKAREADTTPKDCPLVPVPEHGRMIDADALMQKDNDDYDIALLLTTDDEVQSIITKLHIQMQRVLKDAPTIIQTEEGDNG